MKYIANSFSPSMIQLPSLVQFEEITKDEFCSVVRDQDIINSIGHRGTTEIIDQLCESNIGVNRIMINTKPGDEIYIFQLLIRLEEGKILSAEELQKLLDEQKIKFIKAKVYKDSIADLLRCKGVCNEKEYDALIYQLFQTGDQQ